MNLTFLKTEGGGSQEGTKEIKLVDGIVQEDRKNKREENGWYEGDGKKLEGLEVLNVKLRTTKAYWMLQK